MKQQLQQLREVFIAGLEQVKTLEALVAFEQRFFSRASGEVTKLMSELGKLPEAERKQFGREINEVKQELQKKIQI